MDINNDSDNSPWNNPGGTFPTKEEILQEKNEERNRKRKQDPMAQLGAVLMQTMLERRGWPEDIAEAVAWMIVGVIPATPDDFPAWPGFVEVKAEDKKED